MKIRIAAVAVSLAAAAAILSGANALPAAAATSLSCSPNSTDDFTYRGGLIEFDTQVTLIFGVSWWKRSATATHVITEMKQLFTGLYHSSWAMTALLYASRMGTRCKACR